ncbi:kinesin family member C2/C3 [Marchantia polymorpha subsp. ruderalis]
MDVDDEIVATIPPKTLGRRISEELGKEPRRKSPSVRDSLGEAYVRKVADWLEAGGPRGSMEEMYSSFSEANGHTKSENENASADMFDSTMYFDSTQTWDAAEYALKNAQHPGNATNGRVRRRSAEATYVRNSRMAEKKTDLTQNFTEDLRFEDPLDHHDESDSVGEEQDEPDIPSISQPGSSGTDAIVQNQILDRRSSSSSIPRSPIPELSPNAQNHPIDVVESDSELMTEDYSRILTKLCVRVFNDAEAIKKNPGELVIALNAGSPTPAYSSSGIEYLKDQNYVGGDVLRTEEKIGETAEQALYQTARYGNISYKFTDLPCGDFYVDLHFAEIVFSNGPSGMRVFDVYIQGEKVISDLDVYGEVGSNKALILCAKTCVVNGSLIISFEGVIGNPTISAICVRRAPYSGTIQAPKSIAKTEENVYETSVEPVEVEHKSRRQQVKSKNRAKTAEYEAKLEALKNECHEAWISLQDSNRSIERLQNELVSKSVTIDALANVVETQEAEMKELKDKAEGGMLRWKTAFANLFHEMEVVKANFVILARETKDWITTFPDTTGMTSAVQLLVMEHEELRKKYVEESLERRQLYNKVLELKGNIRVFCRCRPLSSFEVTNGASSVVEFDAVKDNELIVRTGNASKKLFKFDRVFTPQDDQGEVFANTAPVVVSVLDGYNVCIFAYGQTGTGKTFTMEGTTDNRGVNYRTLEELFHVAELRKAQFNYEICVSVLEVYNEQIRDLLAPAPEPDQAVKKLEIRQLAEGGHHVPGLVEAPVQTMTQVWDVLQVGSSARAVESTNSNEHSSRSHCMLCVMVKGQNLITGECTRSKLWLVDLAGSERVAKSDVIGDRLREAQSINKSLSALGDVIAALTTKSSHIPFRNSKLTHLLQDSLGGDSKTLMFVQISPNEDDVGESLCSLNFASRVRGVELGPARKQLDSSELFKYKQLAERAKQEGRTKEEAMKKVEDNLRNTEVKLKIKEHMYQVLVEKMKEKEKAVADLEAQLAAEKKARLAATAALKEKGSQHLEKVPIKEVKVPTERVPERRPLLEKVQEFSEPGSRGGMGSPRVAASPRFSAAPVREPVEKEKPHNENADPQHTEAAEEVPPIKPARTKVVPSRYNSPTIGRKILRKPMRASIASTYTINPVTLTSSFSSDESGPDGAKENARFGNDAGEMHSSATHPQNGSASTTVASAAPQRRAVHFASPVFQKEKMGESKHKEAQQQSQPMHSANVSERSMSLGGASDAKKLGVGKLRRVSIARTFGRFPPGAVGGAQRVLSTAAAIPKGGTTVSQLPKERRWNK